MKSKSKIFTVIGIGVVVSILVLFSGTQFAAFQSSSNDLTITSESSVVRGEPLTISVACVPGSAGWCSIPSSGLALKFGDEWSYAQSSSSRRGGDWTPGTCSGWSPGKYKEVSGVQDDCWLPSQPACVGLQRDKTAQKVSTTIDTTGLSPGWHTVSAYWFSDNQLSCSVGKTANNMEGLVANYEAANTGKPFVNAWKKVFIIPQDCSIGQNEMLITQEFSSGDTIMKNNMRWPVGRFCDSAPTTVLRTDTLEITQDWIVTAVLDRGDSYTVPPSRVISVSYITPTPADLSKICDPGQSYYASTDSCGLPGIVHYCSGGGTFDAEAGTCTVQSLINCPQGTFWSDIAEQCVQSVCPSGSFWSTKLKTCLKGVDSRACRGIQGASYDIASGNCVLEESYHECVLDPGKAEPWELESLPQRTNTGCDVIGCPPQYDCSPFTVGNVYDTCVGLGASTNEGAGQEDCSAFAEDACMIVDVATGSATACYFKPVEQYVECGEGFTPTPDGVACAFTGTPEVICPEGSEPQTSGGQVTCVMETGLIRKCPAQFSYEPSIDKCVGFPSLKAECPSNTDLDETQGYCLYVPEVAVRCMVNGQPDPNARYDTVLDKCVRTVSTEVECDMAGTEVIETESGAFSCVYHAVTDVQCPMGGDYNAEENKCILRQVADCGALFHDKELDACVYTPKTVKKCPVGTSPGAGDYCVSEVEVITYKEKLLVGEFDMTQVYMAVGAGIGVVVLLLVVMKLIRRKG